MKRILGYLKIALGIGVVLFLIAAFVVDVYKPMPDYAHVMVDDKAKIYHSPIHFYDGKEDGWQNLRLTTAGEAIKLGYVPDSKCRDDGNFGYDKGALIWTWLEEAGIYKPKDRWNPDGTWNW